jgi:hypothetical protein
MNMSMVHDMDINFGQVVLATLINKKIKFSSDIRKFRREQLHEEGLPNNVY